MALLGDIMGSMSPASSQQSSQSQAQSGLWGPERAAINARAPGDITNLWGQYNDPNSIKTTLPQLDQTGLYPEQRFAALQAVNQGVSKLSGDTAARGWLSPENIGGIAGGATTNLMAQLFPLISQNIATREGASQNRFGQALQLLQAYPGLLGQQSSATSSGSAEGPGLGYQVLGSFAGGFGQALGSKIGAGGGGAKQPGE
jgi:hypothetical protein